MIHPTYALTTEIYSLNQKTRTAYGIAVFADDAATILDEINDIVDHPSSLVDLIQLCNQLELSPLHLRDVVDDFLFNTFCGA